MSKSGKNNFDLIRLLAALSVAVCHLLQINSKNTLYSAVSQTAVNGFFVVSGHLIHKSANRLEILPYFRNRSRRIFPALIVNLFVISFVFAPIVSTLKNSNYMISDAIVYLLKNLTLVPSWAISIAPLPSVSPLGSGWNNPLWTLGFEFLAYVGILILVKLFASYQNFSMLICAIFLGLIHASTNVGNLFNSGSRLGLMFVFGALVGQFRFTKKGIVLFLVVPIMVVIFSSSVDDDIMIIAFVTSVLVVSLALLLPPLPTFLSGDYSYGIYIWHWPIFQVFYFCLHPKLSLVILQLVSLIATVFISFLSFHGVEKRWLVSRS
jgi:peptidoglycan/LPS O-acetylase OafA/YrhL